jgi:hypothetical protein
MSFLHPLTRTQAERAWLSAVRAHRCGHPQPHNMNDIFHPAPCPTLPRQRASSYRRRPPRATIPIPGGFLAREQPKETTRESPFPQAEAVARGAQTGTWQFFLTDSDSTDSGPTLKSSLGGSIASAIVSRGFARDGRGGGLYTFTALQHTTCSKESKVCTAFFSRTSLRLDAKQRKHGAREAGVVNAPPRLEAHRCLHRCALSRCPICSVPPRAPPACFLPQHFPSAPHPVSALHGCQRRLAAAMQAARER